MAYVACKDGGFTDVKLANLFNVSRSTINVWKRDYPDFKAEILRGKDDFDTKNVEGDLLKRARGFTYTEVTKEPETIPIRDPITNKVIGIEEKMRVTKTVKKMVVPSVTAQIYWLKNRNRERWPDKIDIDFNDLTVRRVKKRFDGESGGKSK